MDISAALKIVGRPEYAKYASAPDLKTREGTYVAAVEALVKQADDSEVDAYVRFWNIAQDVTAARQKWAAYNDLAELEDSDYALDVEHNGQRIQKFAAYNADSTVAAARAFHENRHKLPYAWRKTAAVNILSRANRYGSTLPDYLGKTLEKSAGYGVPTEEGLRNLLSERFAVAGRRFGDELGKLAEYVDILATTEELRYDIDMVKQASQAFDLFDRETGMAQHYASGRVSLPEDAIDHYTTLSVLEKAAESAVTDSVSLINGLVVNPHTLDKTALATVDPDLMNMSVAQLADILPTLPLGDANLLQRLVQ